MLGLIKREDMGSQRLDEEGPITVEVTNFAMTIDPKGRRASKKKSLNRTAGER